MNRRDFIKTTLAAASAAATTNAGAALSTTSEKITYRRTALTCGEEWNDAWLKNLCVDIANDIAHHIPRSMWDQLEWTFSPPKDLKLKKPKAWESALSETVGKVTVELRVKS